MDDTNRHVSTQGGDSRGALILGKKTSMQPRHLGRRETISQLQKSDNNAADFVLPTTRPTGVAPGYVIPRLSASSTLDQLNVHFCSMF